MNVPRYLHRLSPRMTRRRFLPHLMDVSIAGRLPSYFLQCGLASVSLVIILLLEDVVLRAAIVVAVASSAFIVFVVPNSVAAMPRKVIGGHVVGVVIGTLCWALLLIPAIANMGGQPRFVLDIVAALSVGISIFLMVITHTEHPPAAGTALGLVIHGASWHPVVFILLGALILSVIRLLLRPKLINLI